MSEIENASRPISEPSKLVPWRVACHAGCGAAEIVGVSAICMGSAAELAARALLASYRWMRQGSLWFCERCWQRRMSASGVTDDVRAAILNRGRAALIEVVP